MSEVDHISPPAKTALPVTDDHLLPTHEGPLPHDGPTKKRLNSESSNIQAKLTVGAPDDPYEKEAEAMADQVMRMQEPTFVEHKTAGFRPQSLQRNTDEEEEPLQLKRTDGFDFVQKKCEECEKEEENIQRKPLSQSITPLLQRKSESHAEVNNSLVQSIESSKGGGSTLDGNTQSFMSSRFGNDFSNVKIHTDSQAVQLSRKLNAKAFTVGRDVYFNQGQYQPNSSEGKQLLAHELTHVVQQTGAVQTKLIQRKPATAVQGPDIGFLDAPVLKVLPGGLQKEEMIQKKLHISGWKISPQLDLGGPEDPSEKGGNALVTQLKKGGEEIQRKPFREKINPGIQAKDIPANSDDLANQQMNRDGREPAIWRSEAETIETETEGREMTRAENFRPEQVVQGRVSDCYLLAALIALTNSVRGRARLAEIIQTSDNENFQVTLFLRPIPGGPFVPREFSVGGFTHPEQGGAPSQAAPWVRAVERAYAQLYGGRIHMSGDSGGILIGGAQRALEHLTGEEASRFLITTETDRDQLWRQMATALGQGLPVVAGTSQRADNPDNHALGVFGSHNYAVVAVRGNGPERQVRIHNPWGRRNRQSPPGIEADFEIDFDLFAEYFVHLTVGYQSETPGLESGISGISAPNEETIERGVFETQREQMLHFVQINEVRSAVDLLGRLIRRVSVGLTPPAPLGARPITNLRINTQSEQGTSYVGAGVDIRYAFENQDDYWRWIEFGFNIIGHSEAYTRDSIAHELQHCADIANDLQSFATLPGPHTAERFIEYASTRSRSRGRHTEIYAQMAAPENFVQWDPRDRLDWLHGALMELPLHVPSHQRLAVEDTIEQFYTGSSSQIQENIWREIRELTIGEVQRARDSSQADLIIAYGRARTILDHFSFIWSDRNPQRDIIERNVLRNTTPEIQRP